jgi:glycosyltransferase involved in cell wall biosynthesis
MRVLMLNHNVAWRSTFFRAFYFGRELADRGHEVTVVTISETQRARFETREEDGVRIVESPDLGVGLARTGWDPYDALRRVLNFLPERFEIVHGFDCRPVVLAPSLALALLSRGAFVSDWADWWGRGGAISERKSWLGRVAMAPFETFLEERFRGFARQLTVTSRALEQRALSMGLHRDRVHYIPSGANVRTVNPVERQAARRELQLPEDAPIACFVGFVQYDLELVLKAFALAKAKVPGARLLLAGPKNEAAQRLGVQLGIDDVTTDLGLQPFTRIPTVLGAADVLLLPVSDNLMNRARGPIKLGDYLAAGRAILANPVGDLASVFQDDDVGAVAPDTAEGYGAALATLLADRNRCDRLGKRAREVAEQKYAWSFLAPKLEAVYDRAVAGF